MTMNIINVVVIPDCFILSESMVGTSETGWCCNEALFEEKTMDLYFRFTSALKEECDWSMESKRIKMEVGIYTDFQILFRRSRCFPASCIWSMHQSPVPLSTLSNLLINIILFFFFLIKINILKTQINMVETLKCPKLHECMVN